MKNAIVILALVALLPLGAWAQGDLSGEPLKPMPYDEYVKEKTQNPQERQNKETFSFAAKADPKLWVTLDIKAQCNMNIYSGDGPKCAISLPLMETGRRSYYGVPFDIVDPAGNGGKSAIALPAAKFLDKELPNTVSIPVGRKLKMIYALLVAHVPYPFTSGEQLMRLDYADGTSHVFPIRPRIDVGMWRQANARIYSGTTRCVLIPTAKENARDFRNMHIVERANPNPDKEIKSITFKTDLDAAMAFCVAAVTGYPAQ